jgi:DNA-binding GntR family transcriptional regulator
MALKHLIKGAVSEESTVPPSSIGANHQSLQVAVTRSLRDAIIKGKLQPGERLRELQLAQMFQVSRNPVREALLALQAEGLIEASPRRGARVRLISHEEVEELIELRIELERLNARKAAQRCDAKLRHALEDLVAQGDEAARDPDTDRLRELNDRFHNLVASAGCNRYLTEYVRTLREKTLWLFASARSDRVVESWREHAAIAQAIMAGDAELSALLAARHVKTTGDWVRTQLSGTARQKAGPHPSHPLRPLPRGSRQNGGAS